MQDEDDSNHDRNISKGVGTGFKVLIGILGIVLGVLVLFLLYHGSHYLILGWDTVVGNKELRSWEGRCNPECGIGDASQRRCSAAHARHTRAGTKPNPCEWTPHTIQGVRAKGGVIQVIKDWWQN